MRTMMIMMNMMMMMMTMMTITMMIIARTHSTQETAMSNLPLID